MRHAAVALALTTGLFVLAPEAASAQTDTAGREYVIRTSDSARYRLTVRRPEGATPEAVVWLFEQADVGLIDAWRVGESRSIWPGRGVPTAVVSLVRLYETPPANGPEADMRIIGAHIPADVTLWTGTALEGRAEETALAIEEVLNVFADRHPELAALPAVLHGRGYQATQVLWMAATRPEAFDIYRIDRAWLAEETVGPVLAGIRPGPGQVEIAVGPADGVQAYRDRLATALRDQGRTVIDLVPAPLLPLGLERPCAEFGEC